MSSTPPSTASRRSPSSNVASRAWSLTTGDLSASRVVRGLIMQRQRRIHFTKEKELTPATTPQPEPQLMFHLPRGGVGDRSHDGCESPAALRIAASTDTARTDQRQADWTVLTSAFARRMPTGLLPQRYLPAGCRSPVPG
jgi:hypothetical protein